LKRLLTLSFQYYYLLLLYNIAFSGLIAVLFFFIAHTLTFSSALAAKIVGFICAAFLYGYSSGKTYFYFKNAGITIWHLVAITFLIDLLVLALLTPIITFAFNL
jgi:hypothetical protein